MDRALPDPVNFFPRRACFWEQPDRLSLHKQMETIMGRGILRLLSRKDSAGISDFSFSTSYAPMSCALIFALFRASAFSQAQSTCAAYLVGH
jgi:hypothetical protein